MRRRSTVLVALAVALAGLAVGVVVDLVDDHERTERATTGAAAGAGCGSAPLVAVGATEPVAGGPGPVVVVRPEGAPAPATPADWVAGQPDISPDQQRLVVVRAEGDDGSTGPGSTHLWTLGLDGADPRPVTSGEVADTAPRWSPDGGSIAFARRTGEGQVETRTLAVVPATGGEAQELVRADGPGAELAAPEWSPDGTRLAYLERRVDADGRSEAATLWTVGADGTAPVEVGPVDAEAIAVDWHPDGSRLLVSSLDGDASDLALVDLATGASTVLARGATWGRWSQGGSHVVHHTLIGVVETDTWSLVERPIDGTDLGVDRDLGVHTAFIHDHDGLSVADCQS